MKAPKLRMPGAPDADPRDQRRVTNASIAGAIVTIFAFVWDRFDVLAIGAAVDLSLPDPVIAALTTLVIVWTQARTQDRGRGEVTEALLNDEEGVEAVAAETAEILKRDPDIVEAVAERAEEMLADPVRQAANARAALEEGGRTAKTVGRRSAGEGKPAAGGDRLGLGGEE